MKIESFIRDITRILERIDQSIDTTINLFNVISNGHTDEQSHSNILAWLLTPRNVKSNLFLQSFLENILTDIPYERFSIDLNQIKVYREYKNIDILILHENNFVIAIENKIQGSPDEKQLTKYENVISKFFHEDEGYIQKFVYLTKRSGGRKSIPKTWRKIDYLTIRLLIMSLGNKDSNISNLLYFYKRALDEMIGEEKKRYQLNGNDLKLFYNLFEMINNLVDYNTNHLIDSLVKRYDYILNKILFYNPKIIDWMIIHHLKSKNHIIDTRKSRRTRFLSEELSTHFFHPKIYNDSKTWSKRKRIFLFEINNNRDNDRRIVLSLNLGPIRSEFKAIRKQIEDQINSEQFLPLEVVKSGKDYTTLYSHKLLRKEEYNIYGLQHLKRKIDVFFQSDYVDIEKIFTSNSLNIDY